MEEIDNTEKGEQGERFVNEIAYHSFLKYWCYPGPLDIAKDNKEICDLLVVFRSVCIIVSVKNYSFKGNYERYFRSTTERAIRQIHGAEKSLWRNDLPVLLQHPDRAVETFEKSAIRKVYRIVINLNTSVKLYQTNYFDKQKEFIVMDSEAWSSAMQELDTLPDFINYLNERLILANKGSAFILPRDEFDFGPSDGDLLAKFMFELPKEGNATFISGSELDLIATYYGNEYAFPRKLLDPQFNVRSLKLDGEWIKFFNSDAYKKKLKLQSEGYFIDQIVKEMIIDKVNGEKLSKMLFSLNRFQRTFLAIHFNDFHSQQSKTGFRHRPLYYVKYKPSLVFFYFVDDLDEKLLQQYTELYLNHANYFTNYSLAEIGLLGKSHSGDKYVFGHIKNAERPDDFVIRKFEETFKAFDLRLTTHIEVGELDPIEIPFKPLDNTPFFR